MVVFPTDTVYGVGCFPWNVAAIERIYAAKGREHTKALPILLSSSSRVIDVAEQLSADGNSLGALFWPGALTLVVNKRPGLPAALGGGDTVAVRVPDHAWACDFIELCGGALAVTSANLSGMPDALDSDTAGRYLGSSVDLIVDGGPSGGSLPSTVIDCTVSPPRILRQGAIAEGSLLEAVETIQRAKRAQG